MFDFTIKGGRVVDGTGNRWRRTDIGIKDGRIAQIGELAADSAVRVIIGGEQVVCPGFIDIHSHSDCSLITNPRAESAVMQGITTEVIGNCGGSLFPINFDLMNSLKDMAGSLIPGAEELILDQNNLGDYLGLLEQTRLSVNVIPLIGHGALRLAVMGYNNGQPSRKEMVLMQNYLDRYFQEGVFGISTGLTYAPGSFADSAELTELCRVVSRHGGFYATHIRGEARTVERSLAEAIEIGEQAAIAVHISHIKAFGSANWGKAGRLLEIMERARERGVDISCDAYPYLSGSSFLHALLPPWLYWGEGIQGMLKLLKSGEFRKKVEREIETNSTPGWWNPVYEAGGWDKVRVIAVQSTENKFCEGLKVTEIAEIKGSNPYDTVFDLLLSENGQVFMMIEIVCEEDLSALLCDPHTAVGTDGWSETKDSPQVRKKIHPRHYGTFPRILGRYVRERGLICLEEAVRKMSALPAQRLGLQDRGLLRERMAADLVIFDPDTIIDRATDHDPRQFSSGINYVFVNGVPVVDCGALTDNSPGLLLRRPC